MAQPYSPTNSTGQGYLGLQGARIVGVEDRTAQYDWADVFLAVELELERSKYTADLTICGTFDFHEGTEEITENSLVRHVFYFAQAVGWTGGLDIHGQFCLGDGTVIDDIERYLQDTVVPAFDEQARLVDQHEYPYLVYFYKAWNPKKRRAYHRVLNKIVQNTPEDRQELVQYLGYMRRNGYLNEYQEDTQTPKQNQSNQPVQLKDTLPVELL